MNTFPFPEILRPTNLAVVFSVATAELHGASGEALRRKIARAKQFDYVLAPFRAIFFWMLCAELSAAGCFTHDYLLSEAPLDREWLAEWGCASDLFAPSPIPGEGQLRALCELRIGELFRSLFQRPIAESGETLPPFNGEVFDTLLARMATKKDVVTLRRKLKVKCGEGAERSLERFNGAFGLALQFRSDENDSSRRLRDLAILCQLIPSSGLLLLAAKELEERRRELEARKELENALIANWRDWCSDAMEFSVHNENYHAYGLLMDIQNERDGDGLRKKIETVLIENAITDWLEYIGGHDFSSFNAATNILIVQAKSFTDAYVEHVVRGRSAGSFHCGKTAQMKSLQDVAAILFGDGEKFAAAREAFEWNGNNGERFANFEKEVLPAATEKLCEQLDKFRKKVAQGLLKIAAKMRENLLRHVREDERRKKIWAVRPSKVKEAEAKFRTALALYGENFQLCPLRIDFCPKICSSGVND
jgi:hypothetical protein